MNYCCNINVSVPFKSTIDCSNITSFWITRLIALPCFSRASSCLSTCYKSATWLLYHVSVVPAAICRPVTRVLPDCCTLFQSCQQLFVDLLQECYLLLQCAWLRGHRAYDNVLHCTETLYNTGGSWLCVLPPSFLVCQAESGFDPECWFLAVVPHFLVLSSPPVISIHLCHSLSFLHLSHFNLYTSSKTGTSHGFRSTLTSAYWHHL